MKQFNTTTLKSIITLAILFFATTSFSKTYIAVNSGKWSDAATWANDAPGNTISADDEVIVKNHITMNTDVSVSGTLTIEKGMTMVSNKTLVITTEGKLVNNGNITLKRVVNEGTINNNAMMESMNEMENKGALINNSNMVAGTNLLNFGGNVTGSKGTYFANGTVVSSSNAKYGNDIKIYSNPSEVAQAENTMANNK
jgi:hypothetical protein